MKTLLLKNAQFVLSAPDVDHLPGDGPSEFAFVGRSNVGKSSLINLLCGQHHLAHSSRTPGRTRLLNYFRATFQNDEGDKDIAIVDLPGYGYAKMSKADRENLSDLLSEYLNARPKLCAVLHLVDIRREPSPEELSVSRQLRDGNASYLLVATKADKIVKSKQKGALVALATAFEVPLSDVLVTSVADKKGHQEIWARMWALVGA